MGFWDLFKNKQEQRDVIDSTAIATWAKLIGRNGTDYGAMNISAFFSAVNLIANSVAMLPLKVLNRTGDDSNEMPTHPVARLFGRAWNGSNVSTFQFFKSIVENVILRGNGYAYVKRDGDGNVTELRYLTPSQVTVFYDPVKGTLYYDANVDGRRFRKIEPINMLHFTMHTRDGVQGVSLLSYASRSIGLANDNEDTAAEFFNNGGNVSGYLKAVSGPLSDKQKNEIATAWQAAYGAGGNGIAVLNSNIEYNQLTLSPADSQLLESRAFNVSDIARFFNLNPMLIGGSAGVSYSSVEQLQNYFLTFTLQPWVAMLEGELNRKLLKPSEASLEIVLETNDMLRIDKAAQANYYRAMVDAGILSRNEVRHEIGYNPFEGGDAHTIAYSDAAQNTLNDNNKTEENETE